MILKSSASLSALLHGLLFIKLTNNGYYLKPFPETAQSLIFGAGQIERLIASIKTDLGGRRSMLEMVLVVQFYFLNTNIAPTGETNHALLFWFIERNQLRTNMIDLRHSNCIEEMTKMSEDCIDLTVTSPPYDDLRSYNGQEPWTFEKFKQVANGLWRVTKKGGVVVWVVGDKTHKGSETGTSFKQALYFKEIGFNLHDTMIYHKKNYIPLNHNRYEQCFEYMFVFSKCRPASFNPLLDECKSAGTSTTKRTFYQSPRDELPTVGHKNQGVKRHKIKSNAWELSTNAGAKGHPAQFPERLALDHVSSWSNEGDVVFDPFMGSGTTGKMALKAKRSFIGVELDGEYFEIAQKRIMDA